MVIFHEIPLEIPLIFSTVSHQPPLTDMFAKTGGDKVNSFRQTQGLHLESRAALPWFRWQKLTAHLLCGEDKRGQVLVLTNLGVQQESMDQHKNNMFPFKGSVFRFMTDLWP